MIQKSLNLNDKFVHSEKYKEMKPAYPNIVKRILPLLIFLTLLHQYAPAQETACPLIGAQVFIEPGQSENEIETCFKAMRTAGMEVARIRMFGSHMIREDGTVDFRLYDHAFDCAEKYGIKLFATLFPPTDELTDVGGFKFPDSIDHLHEIESYIRTVVTHFSVKPALYVWVLQNEPGTGGTVVRKTDLSELVRKKFEKENGVWSRSSGYLNADFSEALFHRYYTSWYLGWIAEQVRKYDPEHYTHINPHAIFETLPEYDFAAYGEFLTSLGVSIHASWHLGYFSRDRYSLGVSIMSDIIREAAGDNGFWITEMQGGGVIASGNVPLTPTASEIRQWLWTGIGAGAEGAIFWTLNSRAAVNEAGEWAMLDYIGRPSERLEAAADVIRTVKAEKQFFERAETVKSGICILYNTESMLSASVNFRGNDRYEGRRPSSVMKSVVAAYNSISSSGVMPEIADMDRFSWDSGRYPVAVIPDMIAIPEKHVRKIEAYVRDGGRLIVTGLTGLYNENMLCMYGPRFPLEDCFGGNISEVRVMDNLFSLRSPDRHPELTGHLFKGVIADVSGEVMYRDPAGVSGVMHEYGNGTVIWIPSLVDLGDWLSDDGNLDAFYRKYCLTGDNTGYPVYYKRNCRNTFMRLLSDGDTVMAIVVNNNPDKVRIRFSSRLQDAAKIYGTGRVTGTCVTVPANEVTVFKFRKH